VPKGMTTRNCRVVVVDDHAVIRRGLKTLLESQPDIEVCGEASNGREAVEMAKKNLPDLLLLDLTMPEMDGLEAIRVIREVSPETEIIVLTMHKSEYLIREMLRLGALGFVVKSDAETELLAAVQSVRQHKRHLTNQLTDTVLNAFISNEGAGISSDGRLPGIPLTAREIDIVRLLAQGKSNKEVAASLGVSSRTVEAHRNHIMHKMKFSSLSELIRFAVRHKLVEP
jgi:DNA-binding NarL/FixJ family response regulator